MNLKEMFYLKTLDIVALLLVIIGAVNWGLIGFFGFNLVTVLFGDMSTFSRIVYSLVGIAGLYSISFLGRDRERTIEK
jgi:uncharacterized membrane protein YuzA (DUF378 family)